MTDWMLASSEFPSGVAWTLNVLLELSVRIHRAPTRSFWIERPGGAELSPAEDKLKQWLPALGKHASFAFPEALAVLWSHEFPDAGNEATRTILMVRDGRDTLYSQLKRAQGLSLSEFLRQPRDSKYLPFRLPPAEHWALHGLLWREVPRAEPLLVRFEDTKRDPTAAVHAILKALGVARGDDAIARAVDASTFERAQAAEQKYFADRGAQAAFVVNRAGKPGEWRANYGDAELECFAGLPDLALARFGYEQSGAQAGPLPASAREAAVRDWSAYLGGGERVTQCITRCVGALADRPLTRTALGWALVRENRASEAAALLEPVLDRADANAFELAEAGRVAWAAGDRPGHRRAIARLDGDLRTELEDLARPVPRLKAAVRAWLRAWRG